MTSAATGARSTGSSAAAADGRSTRWDEHRQQRRSALIRATRAAVHELGPDASMEEIAVHAGTSKSVFYRYFGDKNGLQRAVGERSIHYMERELLSAAHASEHALEGLYNMVEAYLRLAESSPNVYTFATRIPDEDGGRPPRRTGEDGAAPIQGFFERIAAVMDRHYRDHLRQIGREPGPDSTAWYWPLGAIGMVRSTGEAWLATPTGAPRPTAQRMARTLTTWLIDGLSGLTPAADDPTGTPVPTSSAPAARRRSTSTTRQES